MAAKKKTKKKQTKSKRAAGKKVRLTKKLDKKRGCLLYTSPSPRD